MNVREIIAAVLTLLAPVVYFIFSETTQAAPYQTTAGHALLLITIPVGLGLIWLAERRPSTGHRPTPLWARLLLGGAAGLLLATALQLVNGLSAGAVEEFTGTSLGSDLESGALAGHAAVRLDDGRTMHLLNTFCGVKGARVTVYLAQGLLGLDRVIACALPSERPLKPELPDRPAR